MTPKELYDWAVENGYENFKIITDANLGEVLTKRNIEIDIINEWLYI